MCIKMILKDISLKSPLNSIRYVKQLLCIMYYYLILSFKMWKEFFPYYGWLFYFHIRPLNKTRITTNVYTLLDRFVMYILCIVGWEEKSIFFSVEKMTTQLFLLEISNILYFSQILAGEWKISCGKQCFCIYLESWSKNKRRKRAC